VATDRSGFKWLHRSLTERFSREEIGALCLSLDIPREDVLVGGETILAAANRLIEFCRHHGKEDALASLVVEAARETNALGRNGRRHTSAVVGGVRLSYLFHLLDIDHYYPDASTGDGYDPTWDLRRDAYCGFRKF
jgi:hypothetical protein